MLPTVRIHPQDDVAVALSPLAPGAEISGADGRPLRVVDAIPQAHKVSLRAIPKGTKVMKYGSPIGVATQDISPGAHVHTHNLRTGLGDMSTYIYQPNLTPPFSMSPDRFAGYPRKDGRVGVRNDIWVLPTVGCVNGIAQQLVTLASPYAPSAGAKVLAFPHPYGCSQMGEDQEATLAILADLALHPNAGGVLLLGLGCENCNIERIKPLLGDFDRSRIRFLVCQESQDELADGLALIQELLALAAQDTRQDASTEKLAVGLKCGGSDGLSGITANPVIGAFSDRLVARGGATMLTEVPEMFGAETLLMARCPNEALFSQTVSLINDFKQYYLDHHQPIDQNPSPGNKAGGITTLEDKALGCTQKSGSAPVAGVLSYGQRLTTPGLHLLSAPGNDLVASTALAAAGAQIVLFSTGRGTPFACPVPTVKISSNTGLATHKERWIDFDAGRVVMGMSIADAGQELYDLVLRVASGMEVKHEVAGIHDLAIFKRGVTL